jgi:hypothetical protein
MSELLLYSLNPQYLKIEFGFYYLDHLLSRIGFEFNYYVHLLSWIDFEFNLSDLVFLFDDLFWIQSLTPHPLFSNNLQLANLTRIMFFCFKNHHNLSKIDPVFIKPTMTMSLSYLFY